MPIQLPYVRLQLLEQEMYTDHACDSSVEEQLRRMIKTTMMKNHSMMDDDDAEDNDGNDHDDDDDDNLFCLFITLPPYNKILPTYVRLDSRALFAPH